MYTYKPDGVCCKEMSFDIIDGRLKNISFKGGCQGNLSALADIFDGEDARTVALKMYGHKCGNRNTSCMDRFARFVLESLRKEKENGD